MHGCEYLAAHSYVQWLWEIAVVSVCMRAGKELPSYNFI